MTPRIPFSLTRQKRDGNKLHHRLMQALSSDRWSKEQKVAIKQFLSFYEPYVGDRETWLVKLGPRIHIWNTRRWKPGSTIYIDMGPGF